MKKLFNYYNDWEGWSCDICGVVIENTTKEMILHLREKHKIEVEE